MASPSLVCRSTLYLNNSGVALILAGKYNDAAATLKDAVLFMKRAVTSSSMIHSNELVDKAAKLLAFTNSNRDPQEVSSNCPPTKVVSLDGTIDEDTMNVIYKEKQGTIAMLIRIDTVESSEGEERLYGIIPAIVLQNYGLATLLAAPMCSQSTRVAIQILNMSIRTLGVSEILCEESEFLSEDHLFMCMVVLSNLRFIGLHASSDSSSNLCLSPEETKRLRMVASVLSTTTKTRVTMMAEAA